MSGVPRSVLLRGGGKGLPTAPSLRCKYDEIPQAKDYVHERLVRDHPRTRSLTDSPTAECLRRLIASGDDSK